MTSIALKRLVTAALPASLLLCACAANGMHPEATARPMTQQEAVEIARRAVVGKADVPASAPTEVEFENDRVIVIFRTQLPPGTRGADYHAKVTLNARTREVMQILGGS